MNLILSALIGGLCTGIPTIISVITTNKKNTALITYRIAQLEEKVKEHNNWGLRMQKIEDDVNYLKHIVVK